MPTNKASRNSGIFCGDFRSLPNRVNCSRMNPLKKINKLRTRKSSPSPARDQNSNEKYLLSTISPNSTLGSGNLRMAVTLPQGEDLNEWIACNIADFYKQVI